MARAARVVAEGVPHHITQRGNNRQNVFLLDEDRRFYIEALRAKSRQHGLTILGYCLMTNHVHLIEQYGYDRHTLNGPFQVGG
jgi:putative transposase